MSVMVAHAQRQWRWMWLIIPGICAIALAADVPPSSFSIGPSTKMKDPTQLQRALRFSESSIDVATVSVLLQVMDKSELASTQQNVLDSLDGSGSDFLVLHRYQRCSGLLLQVDSLGMHVLMANELVREIEFETGPGIERGRGVKGTRDIHRSTGEEREAKEGEGIHATTRRRDLLDKTIPLINADQRHARGNTGAGVAVAVLDSGFDALHPDLEGALIHEACFGETDNDGRLKVDGVGFCPNGSDRQFGRGAARDDRGHGTAVSGVIVSKGIVGSLGVAPDSNIVAVKLLDSGNSIRIVTEVIQALEYLLVELLEKGTRIDLINMSFSSSVRWTGPCNSDFIFQQLSYELLQTMRDDWNVTAFASAGNNNDYRLSFPACLSNVIAVASSTDDDRAASTTNSGLETGIFAPGDDVEVPDYKNNGTTRYAGTSFASPHAVGCAALLIQNQDAMTPDDIEARLKMSDIQVSKFNLAFPRINCKVDPSAICRQFSSLEECSLSPPNAAMIAAINNESLGDPVSFSFEPASSLRPGNNVVTMTIHDAVGLTSSCTSILYVPCSEQPSQLPSAPPSMLPTFQPSGGPSNLPSHSPSAVPTFTPSTYPSSLPSISSSPSEHPDPSASPSHSFRPSSSPSAFPIFSSSQTQPPTFVSSGQPTRITTTKPSQPVESPPEQSSSDGSAATGGASSKLLALSFLSYGFINFVLDVLLG